MVRRLHHVELHSMVHRVRVHLAKAEQSTPALEARRDQPPGFSGQEAALARIEYPLQHQVVGRRAVWRREADLRCQDTQRRCC